MTEIASITPQRIERLRPSDIRLIARHSDELEAMSIVLASFVSYLRCFKDPTASEIDDVLSVSLQLKAADAWKIINAVDLMRAFRKYVDQSIYETVIKAVGVSESKDFTIIEYIAQRLGLDPATKELLPEAATGVAAPIPVDVVQDNKVAIVAGAQNTPNIKSKKSSVKFEKLHHDCLKYAEELRNTLGDTDCSVRGAYRESIERYLEDFPTIAGQGNMLLADSEARSLRGLLDEERDSLPPAIVDGLHRFFVAHQSICVFYDGVGQFYEQVRTGVLAPRLEETVVEFLAAIEQSPDFIDAAVVRAFREVDLDFKRLDVIAARLEIEKAVVPADPISLSPLRAWHYGVIGAMNAIYAAYRATKAPVGRTSSWLLSGQALAAITAPALSRLGASGPEAQLAGH